MKTLSMTIGLMLLGGAMIELPAVPAVAGEPDPAAAREFFAEGTRLYNNEDFVGASKAFEAAYEKNPSWKLQYNIAQCAAAMKQYGRALEAFENYLFDGGDEVPEDRQVSVREEIARLRDLTGELSVNGRPGDSVLIDGVEAATLPLIGPLRLSGGTHSIRVVRQGVVLIDRQVRMASRGNIVIDVPADSAAAKETIPSEKPATQPVNQESEVVPDVAPEKNNVAAASKPVAPETSKNRGLRTGGIVVLSIGGAALVGSVVTGAMSLSKSSELESACPSGVCDSSADLALEDQKNNLAVTTDVLIGVGATLAVTGVVMLIVDHRKQKSGERLSNSDGMNGSFRATTNGFLWRF